MLYLYVAVWTDLWDSGCMKVLWTCFESFLIVVFQELKHCVCLMWFVLTSTRSGNVDSVIKVVTDICQVINRVLSLHHQSEHQVSFSWQQVPCLVWINIQYCRKSATRLLRMWFWVLQRTCKAVSCECYVLSGRYLALGWSLIQKNSTKCNMSNSVWSWSLKNEKAMAHDGLSCHKNKTFGKNRAMGRMLFFYCMV